MRAWFQGGPLDGYECDLSIGAGDTPQELWVCLREFVDDLGETRPIEHGSIAAYVPIEDAEGGYQALRRPSFRGRA